MSKDREAKFELRVRNQRQKRRTLVVGLPLPPEIQSVHEDTTLHCPQTPSGRVSSGCKPRHVHLSTRLRLLRDRLTFGFLGSEEKGPTRL